MLYQKTLIAEARRALKMPIDLVKASSRMRLALFRADLLPAGVKTSIGMCLTASYLDWGLINSSTKALVVQGSGNTVRAVKMAVDKFNLDVKVVAVVYEETNLLTVRDLRSRGIEVVSDTPKRLGRVARQSKAKYLCRRRGWILVEQHEQPRIVEIQRETFGLAVATKLGGSVTHFVAGVGTGGTLFGISNGLKSISPDLKVTALEGLGSTLTLWYAYLKVKGAGYANEKKAIEKALTRYRLAGVKTAFKYYPDSPDPRSWFEIDVNTPGGRTVGIEGLGVGDPTQLILNHLPTVDGVRIVTDEEAEEGAQALQEIGIQACESAGANFFAAQSIARSLNRRNVTGTVLTIITGRRNGQGEDKIN